MKLKNIFALATLGLSFVACDDIKESERFIPITTEMKTDKVVLIEDFTGMNCINCPNAAEKIKQIQNTYGADKVIAVAIHGEVPGLSGPLANALGTEYCNHWGVETLPIGMVDRQGLQNYESWMAKVNERLTAQVAPLSLSLENTFFNSEGTSLFVEVDALASAELDAKLQVWITESNIKGFQKMPDGSFNFNYVHNHVLRDTVNGYWGESITLEAGVKQTITYAYELPAGEEWKLENLAVVAFVYNDSGVIQATEKVFAEHEIPEVVAKPEFAFEYNDAVLADGATLTLEAQNGTAATLANALALVNTGALPLSATATLEIIEDVPGTAFTLNAFGETAVVETAKATVEGEVAAGEKSFAGLSATFAEGAYGTVKAKLTVTAGEVSKAVLVNFVNPAPVAPEVPFQLVYNGAVLENGATLDIAAIITDLTEFMPDYYIVEAKTNDAENALNIHNLTGDVLSATVDVEVLEDVEGTAYSLCSFGDCFPVKDGRGQKTGEVIAYGEAETGWDVTFTHGMTGTAKTKLTVTSGEYSQTVYVNFVYEAQEEAPAGSFQLVYNGKPVAEGETLNIAAIITDLTEFMPDYYIVEAKTNDTENALNIHNLTGDVLSATVDVEVLKDVEGTAYSLCSFGDCFPVKDGRGQKTGEVIAYGEAETGWDVTFTHGMKGTAKTKLTVTVGAETQTVYVNFVYN